MKYTRVIATILVFTTLVLFIGSFFQLELPSNVLLNMLKKNLPIALLSGIVSTLILEWAKKKQES